MSSNFATVVEQVQQLSVEEKSLLQVLLEKYLMEERRTEIYQHYQATKAQEDQLEFTSDWSKLKYLLEEEPL